jgi:hypothetical protein
MTVRRPTFYGSVLKAVACTPNRNPDDRVYDAEVLPRARRLRQAQAALGDGAPTADQIAAALDELAVILRAKCVAEEEIRDRMQEIAELHPGASWSGAAPCQPVLIGMEEAAKR